jgi:D-alanyl-D-alanine carboxypeptidase/D-alanyl-D-alanine-endopeptidase (penicillin-binding protein 4)
LGRGDVSISTAFNNGDYYKGIDNLVDSIVAAGVKRIDGSLVGIEGFFRGYAVPATWEWDDLQWYYGAEVSAFPINDNAVDLKVTGGQADTPCLVSILPQNSVMQVTNLCSSTASGAPNGLQVFKVPGKNSIEITGTLPAGQRFEGYVSVTHPADLFLEVLKQRLQLRGIAVTGNSHTLPPNVPPPAGQIEIARLESPPLSSIAARTMKVSQNMYTETLLWTLGEEVGRKSGMSGDSSVLGLAVVNGFLTQAGLRPKSVLQYDGSGLSRHDLATPAGVVDLYRYMANQSKYSAVWRSSLSIGGVDGTLNRRFKGTAVAGNLQGKTGTLDQVSALSGYVMTSGGDQLVLSVIVNGVPEPDIRRSLIDDIVGYVAAFNGKIDAEAGK